jgi:hypothetical protein
MGHSIFGGRIGMRGDEFVDKLAQHVDTRDEAWLPQKFEVSTRDSGLIVLREPVSGEVISQGFAGVGGWAYQTGDEVMAVPVSDQDWFVLGPLMRSALDLVRFDAPVKGQVYGNATDASGSLTPNTTNTATYVDAIVLTWSGLPAGTYDLMCHMSALMSHSAGGDINLRSVMNGIADVAIVEPVTAGSSASERVATSARRTNQVVSGDLIMELEFKGGTAGTTYCRNPNIVAFAIRSA